MSSLTKIMLRKTNKAIKAKQLHQELLKRKLIDRNGNWTDKGWSSINSIEESNEDKRYTNRDRNWWDKHAYIWQARVKYGHSWYND